MRLDTLTSVEYDALDDDDSGDDYYVERGAIRLGPAGEQLWTERNEEFRSMVRSVGNLLLGVFGVSDIEILSSDLGGRRCLDRIVASSSLERHGWYSWFETGGHWEIQWGSEHSAVVDGSGFIVYRHGKSGTGRIEEIAGRVEEGEDPAGNLRSAMSYVEGYLRARTPRGLADWEKFSGRGVRGSVLRRGGST